MKRPPRILVTPLDWGLGHATRCVPVVKALLAQRTEVILGADGGPLALLRQEFPKLPHIRIPGYGITYPEDGNMVGHFSGQLLPLLKAIRIEHAQMEKAVKQFELSGIISDNRFGAWSANVPSVFLTHQLHIRSPKWQWLVRRINRRAIKRFSEVWIPDVENEANSLAGALSHPPIKGLDTEYLGPLTRFQTPRKAGKTKYRIAAVVSGPEPTRSQLYDLLEAELSAWGQPAVLITGDPTGNRHDRRGKLAIHSHLPTQKLQQTLAESDLIISRPGYTTLMDLSVFGKPAVFIPTPGQTEQEYLALRHFERGHALVMEQDQFNLAKAWEEGPKYPGLPVQPASSTLQEIVTGWVDRLR